MIPKGSNQNTYFEEEVTKTLPQESTKGKTTIYKT
jgi:hypothetical protein